MKDISILESTNNRLNKQNKKLNIQNKKFNRQISELRKTKYRNFNICKASKVSQLIQIR